MARKPRPGKEIKAKLRIDPNSLRTYEQALLALREATRKEALDDALFAGAQVAKSWQQRRAPGPHIEIEFVKNVANLQKGSATGLMKKNLSSHARYVAIGPDKAHWYYRFQELGVKAHGVAKRKRTRFQQFGARAKIKRADLRSFSSGKGRKVGGMSPAMSWLQGGRRVFTRRVSGFAARPFVGPSVDENGEAINAAMMKVLRDEIEKAAEG